MSRSSWEKKNRAQEKYFDEQAKSEKEERKRAKKQNQEGVYKKIGPFTIKTWIILAVIIAIGIMMLIDKIKGI